MKLPNSGIFCNIRFDSKSKIGDVAVDHTGDRNAYKNNRSFLRLISSSVRIFR